MLETAVTILFVAGTTLVSGAYAAARARRQRLVRRAWAVAAARLDADVTEPALPAVRSFAASVRGEPVRVDEVRKRERLLASVELWVTAKARMADDVSLVALPRRNPPAMPAIAGLSPMQMDDPPFDRRYLVHAGSESHAQLWLSHSVRRSILESAPYAVVLHGGIVTVWRTGAETSASRLVQAADTAAKIAFTGELVDGQWRDVAERLGALDPDDEGRFPAFDAVQDAVELHVAVDTGGRAELRTVVSAQPSKRTWERFAFGPVDVEGSWKLRRLGSREGLPKPLRSEEPSRTAAWLDAIDEQIAAASPAALLFDGSRVQLFYDGVELNPYQLERGMALVAALCMRMGAAPYR